jgi:hypothetical protein
MNEEKQKEMLLAVTSKLRVGVEGSAPSLGSGEGQAATSSSPSFPTPAVTAQSTTSQLQQPSSPRPSAQITLSAELFQKLAKVDPKLAKYSKMFQVPLPSSPLL